jgi:hypothetical protein
MQNFCEYIEKKLKVKNLNLSFVDEKVCCWSFCLWHETLKFPVRKVVPEKS